MVLHEQPYTVELANMKSKRLIGYISLQVILLFLTILALALYLVKGTYAILVLVPLIFYQVIYLINYQLRLFTEFQQFVESVRYRDFSINFDTGKSTPGLMELRSGFNEINRILKAISREKETQHQYLQKILEVVDTGILFYAEESGEVIWMNESLKKMLHVPYLKNISSISKRNKDLYTEILHSSPSKPGLITLHTDEGSFKIVLSSSSFNTDGKKHALIAFQNINEVLEETETKAWQKLLSVLTHEIMNSIAPISSLAETLKIRIQRLSRPANELEDLEIGIETIKRRSEGLLKFADTYRNLNKISQPELQKVYIRKLFEGIYVLMQPTLHQKNIEMEIFLKDTDLAINADPALIEQVLINLLLNAIEILRDQDDALIVLSGHRDSTGKIVIKVTDNGPGVPENLLDKIYIPFFSTKKNGSGVGLTICKQIMMMHHATIRTQSSATEGTSFILQF